MDACVRNRLHEGVIQPTVVCARALFVIYCLKLLLHTLNLFFAASRLWTSLHSLMYSKDVILDAINEVAFDR